MANSLSGVTAVCVDTLHHRLALRASLQLARHPFAEVVLVTDEQMLQYLPPQRPDKLRVELIAPITSVGEYSRYVLHSLPDLVSTPHVLVFQWDGFVLDIQRWWPGYLDYDYIGAPWPECFVQGSPAVGNGGFSLRSLKLLHAVRELATDSGDRPEDNVICIDLAQRLEHERDIRFAPVAVAKHFSIEHMTLENFHAETAKLPAWGTFGFHGFFNFHLAFDDDELLAIVDTDMGQAERMAVLRSWHASTLVVNLFNSGRLQGAREISARISHACDLGIPGNDIGQVLEGAAALRSRSA